MILTVLAVLAAITAAAVGAWLRPSRRAARKARRHQKQVSRDWAAKFLKVRLTVEGRFAIDGSDTVWLRLLADHPELYARTGPDGGA